MQKKTVLLLKLSNLRSAPRVQRTFWAIKDKFDVTTAGYDSISDQNEKFIDLKEYRDIKDPTIDFHLKYPYILRKTVSAFVNIFVLKGYSKTSYFQNQFWNLKHKAILKRLGKEKYDIVIGHGIDTWPIAYELSKKESSKLVFNAHEYYPLEFEENASWIKYEKPLSEFICKTYLPKADLIFSVTESITEKYKNEFSVNPVTITNAASFQDIKPYLEFDSIKIIHHGAALRGRKIEDMIDCAKLLDERFTFDLMLVPNDEDYVTELKLKIKDYPRINIIDPVPYPQIPQFISKYHIGLYILPKNNFNNEMALPNKFFEFVQARLMLAISPNHEMASIVNKYKIGIVAQDYSYKSLAKKVNSLLTEEIKSYKLNTVICARELNAEKNAEIILKNLESL